MIKTPEKPIESGEAEQTILGALLIRSENIAEILAKIRPEDFYHENHRLIFQAMTDLEESGAPIDYNSVSLELKKSNSLGKIGGIEFLMKLAEQVGFASNYPFFVDVVHEKASLRRFADITARANRAAFNGHRFNSLLLETQEKLASLAAGAGRAPVFRRLVYRTQPCHPDIHSILAHERLPTSCCCADRPSALRV